MVTVCCEPKHNNHMNIKHTVKHTDGSDGQINVLKKSTMWIYITFICPPELSVEPKIGHNSIV